MKGVILAAGRGSRLQNLTAERPKTLVRFNDRPLIEHIVQSLRDGGVAEIGVVSGYRHEALTPFADTFFFNKDWAHTGIFRSLCEAREWLEAEACIISYSDIFFSPEIVSKLRKANGDIVIAYDPTAVELWQKRFAHPLEDLEQFRIDSSLMISAVGGKPPRLADVQGQYMGLFRLSPTGWASMLAQYQSMDSLTQEKADITSLLSGTLAAGGMLRGIATEGPWGEIDHPSDLRLFESLYPNL